MALSDIDRKLLQSCLDGKAKGWEDFVDRFLGLVVHVINHSAQARSMRLSPEDRDDLCGEVMLTVIRDDFAVLRRFRGQSSLATYLTVVARRVAVHELVKRQKTATLTQAASQRQAPAPGNDPKQPIGDRDEVERLMKTLEVREAEVVRLFHLEGKNYQEISSATGIAENSVGPTLTRAREKMRRARTDSPED